MVISGNKSASQRNALRCGTAQGNAADHPIRLANLARVEEAAEFLDLIVARDRRRDAAELDDIDTCLRMAWDALRDPLSSRARGGAGLSRYGKRSTRSRLA
jgi:hypothetical protein